MNMPKGRLNWECMVVPPALSAAMPVGATMAICLWLRSERLLRNVVLPVPAFPVRKMWRPVLLMNCSAVFMVPVNWVWLCMFSADCMRVCAAFSGLIRGGENREMEDGVVLE